MSGGVHDENDLASMHVAMGRDQRVSQPPPSGTSGRRGRGSSEKRKLTTATTSLPSRDDPTPEEIGPALSTSSPLPFLVVGAGIGGVATALALTQRGIFVHVLEQAPEIGEIGAGIQLAPKALRVLDALGVLDEVYDSAVFPPAATMRDATTGEVLARLEFGREFKERYGYPYILIHRSDLHTSLVSAAKASDLVQLRTGARVTGLSQISDDKVEVSLGLGGAGTHRCRDRCRRAALGGPRVHHWR